MCPWADSICSELQQLVTSGVREGGEIIDCDVSEIARETDVPDVERGIEMER